MKKNKYDITSATAPPMPKNLPGFVRLSVSKVPDYMRPAAANALFPPLVAQMKNVSFRYIDNVLHEPCCSMECCVASSGLGKGYLDPMIELYFPDDSYDTASRKLRRWIGGDLPLKEALRRTGYRTTQRHFKESQLNLLKEYFGDPL